MKIQSGYQILSKRKYSVSNLLTHCTNSNTSSKVNHGEEYVGYICADDGYTMTGALVTVLMGGTDITSSVYSNQTVYGNGDNYIVANGGTIESLSSGFTPNSNINIWTYDSDTGTYSYTVGGNSFYLNYDSTNNRWVFTYYVGADTGTEYYVYGNQVKIPNATGNITVLGIAVAEE